MIFIGGMIYKKEKWRIIKLRYPASAINQRKELYLEPASSALWNKLSIK